MTIYEIYHFVNLSVKLTFIIKIKRKKIIFINIVMHYDQGCLCIQLSLKKTLFKDLDNSLQNFIKLLYKHFSGYFMWKLLLSYNN